MKHLTIIIFLFASMSIFAQNTYVPDDNFEQALIGFGYDDVLDDYVLTENIISVTTLDVSGKDISDLAGIEDFIALVELHCEGNQLTSLDISQNNSLTVLVCFLNQLTNLDLTQNTALSVLGCNSNQLTSLDLSQNSALTILTCYTNQLTSIDVRNGNNENITMFFSDDNPYLTCIFVDDKDASYLSNWTIGPASTFIETEEECNALDINNIINDDGFTIYPNPTKEKFNIQTSSKIENIKIYDVFGKLLKVYKKQDIYSISNLAIGVYLIQIQSNEGSQISKLIIE